MSASSDLTLRVWEAGTSGRCIKAMQGHTDGVNSVCALRSGLHLVSASKDRTLRVWEVGTWLEVRKLSGHEGAVACVCELAGGVVVSGASDASLRVWRVATGECRRVLSGRAG